MRIKTTKDAAFVVLTLFVHVTHSFLTPFVVRISCHERAKQQQLFLSTDGSRDNNDNIHPKRSHIEGNQREPTPAELAVMDEMITKLSNAKPYDLPNAVRRAFRVVSSPKFFLRIAELCDMSSNDIEKEKLGALASNLVATLEAVVSTTEEKLNETAKELEIVVKAAAEPDSGEFYVPLSMDRINAMRDAFYKLDETQLDEGFLSTVDAWMNKSYKDGMDLMVVILQKVLQMYAGRKIFSSLPNQTENVKESRKLFEQLLKADAESWDGIIEQGMKDGISANELQVEVQSQMESTVFSLETGSMSQRVVAEYLKEITKRIETIQAIA